MKSTAPNSSLKKPTRPLQHHWCTQRKTSQPWGNIIAGLLITSKENFLDQFCQHPLLMEEASQWADGIKSKPTAFVQFETHPRCSTEEGWSIAKVPWEMQTELPAESPALGLILPSKWWRNPRVPTEVLSRYRCATCSLQSQSLESKAWPAALWCPANRPRELEDEGREKHQS